MQKVSELTAPPVVGKFYLVPCVRFIGEWRPIVGPEHTDVEIGVSQPHYHEDARFSTHHANPMAALASVIPTADWPRIALPQVQWKRRKCRRPMPDQRKAKCVVNPRNNWLEILEKKFVGHKVCGRCPHKGMPLESLPQDENGHVICNGHGLKIDMKKGEVIER